LADINQPEPDYEHPAAAVARLLDAGHPDLAEATALSWIELEPGNPDALIYLCLVYRKTGRHNEELAVAERLRRIHPGHAAAGATQALLVLKRWPEMLASAREWTQYDPNNRDAWMCLAAAATELDDHATRTDALQVLIRFEPDEFRHYEALTVSLGKLGRWSELTDHCREWLDREPESQNAHAWSLCPVGAGSCLPTSGDLK
jgi:tetratricopeptide (TPR) repeat protein